MTRLHNWWQYLRSHALEHLSLHQGRRALRQLFRIRFIRFFYYLNFKTFCQILGATLQQRLPGLAAEMAYNAMLSVFPAILTMLTAIGLFDTATRSTFRDLIMQLSEVAPQEVVTLVEDFIQAQLYGNPSRELFSLSFVATLWVASNALNSAMVALDQIFQTPRRRVRPFWKARLIAIGLTLGTISLMILAAFSVLISGLVVDQVASRSGALAPPLLRLWQLLSWPLALGMVAIAAAFIYRYGPSYWRVGTPLMPGAIVAAFLWAGVSALFRSYVTNFGNYNQIYGAVGAVIILLLWLYLSSLALLLGAQLNRTVGDAMRQKAQSTAAKTSLQKKHPR